MTHLRLGPLLRYAGDTDASFWVETDHACEVGVKVDGRTTTSRSFQVHGHHYAIVHVTDLPSASTLPYTVTVDGEQAWPPSNDPFPPPVVRTVERGVPVRVLFGSCRVSLPHDPPYTGSPDESRWGFQRDALDAYARRMMDQDPGEWPELMFWCGDQIYADEPSPRLEAEYDARRREGLNPGAPVEAADFDEYAMLYQESWADPIIRWFQSVVPSAMIWDDHDVRDDWNSSRFWVDERRSESWWQPKMGAAIASYWVYQHAGNLAPDKLEADDVFERLSYEEDNWPWLYDFAVGADEDINGTRWSFCREIAGTKLVVIDSRAGRVLDSENRGMVDSDEWKWIESEVEGDFDHLLLGTSLPWLLTPALHDLEAWNEAVSEGAWGKLVERPVGERLRQALDLEHWGAFTRSFVALADLAGAVARGERGPAPASIVALSGDVHHAYLMKARWPGEQNGAAPVYQAVCSPIRNPLSSKERRVMRTLRSRPAKLVARAMRRLAKVDDPPIRWEELDGPFFNNQIATLDLDGRRATFRLEAAKGHPARPAHLEELTRRELTQERVGAHAA